MDREKQVGNGEEGTADWILNKSAARLDREGGAFYDRPCYRTTTRVASTALCPVIRS